MSTTEIVHVEPLLPMSPEAAEEAMTSYQELTRRVLTPDDWQGQPGKPGSFVKRRGWAKLATFYGVSTELVGPTRIERGAEGELLRAYATARATHPNGRHADGDGACSITEPRFASDKGRLKVEHDLPATAVTRAVNRAISNLIGFGQVSAEEVVDGEVLDSTAKLDLATSLRGLSPDVDADRFVVVLERRFGGAIPADAGAALRAWAWWADRPKDTTPKSPQTAAGEPTAPVSSTPPDPEPPPAEVVPDDPAEVDPGPDDPGANADWMT
jgi:hypothetical protein